MFPLDRRFYAADTVTVARALLGQRLVRVLDGGRLSGLICETEAYGGPDDRASHAYRRTARSAIMYGLPGHAYVYLIYGMHFCLNAVTEIEGTAGAVLIRALIPEEGLEQMRERRGPQATRHLADGPARLCQALTIDRRFNGTDLTVGNELAIERERPVPDSQVTAGPRIGVRGDPFAVERPWRFVWLPEGGGLPRM
jgi:DNA-3-methyladenine glycosylase